MVAQSVKRLGPVNIHRYVRWVNSLETIPLLIVEDEKLLVSLREMLGIHKGLKSIHG
jgi:hypothetical protein